MTEVDNLTAAVARVQGAKDSAVALINAAAQYIRDHVSDPALLQQYADALNVAADDLGNAVITNPLPATTP